MTILSVNINKVATIRNARGGSEPNLIEFALKCYENGAEGITVHPRPDERHIKYSDVEDLRKIFPKEDCEFNIEGYPNDRFINLVLNSSPTQVTLVPDPPNVLTSSSGWDTKKDYNFLKKTIKTFKDKGLRVALFMDTDFELLKLAKEMNADRVEFYTGYYAEEYSKNKEQAIDKYLKAYNYCLDIGLDMNAGHDLSLENLNYFKKMLPEVKEVSIGHALVCDCLYYGLENTISMYKRKLLTDD